MLLCKLERRSNLSQAERGFALAEQVEDSEGPVQSLNFICALRGGVSHIDPYSAI